MTSLPSPATEGFCPKCRHAIEYHGPDGCDVEVRDYGDMDCGCRAYTFVAPSPLPSPVDRLP